MTPPKKTLLVQDFLRSDPSWEKSLQDPPYSVKVSRDSLFGRNLLMLKYNQMESDLSIPLVKECRGLVLDADSLEVVSFPFTKFFNFGEPHAARIDPFSAKVLQKVDGSLMKVVRLGNDLLVSTNGTIDAFKASVVPQPGCSFGSFGEIFQSVLSRKVPPGGNPLGLFREGFTYMFEMVSPWTRVVIPYKETDLYFLGARDNSTFLEILPHDHPLSGIFPVPKVYPMKTLSDCIRAAKELPWDEEGYVVVDKDFNRVKVKSPAYLQVHHLKGESGSMSYRRAIDIVRSNEIDEIAGYFPEFREGLEECRRRFLWLIESTENSWEEYLKADASLPTRKDKALYIKEKFRFPGIAFGLLDGKISSVRDHFMKIPTESLMKMLGYRESKNGEWQERTQV